MDADVIVVGAGPVGMSAAALIAALGGSTIVIERQQELKPEPKAISLDDESLRTYQAAGIADRVMSVVVPGTGTAYYGADGQFLFHARGPSPYRLGHPFKNPFAQPDLEAVLRDSITEEPLVELRFGWDAVSVDQDSNGVDVEVLVDGTLRTLRAAFVIGADGGRSTVRESLGILMRGRSYPDRWLVVDTLKDYHDERFGLHHGDPSRPRVLVPGLGGRCRYEFRLAEDELGEPGEPPSFDLIQSLVACYRSITPEEIERAVIYRFNAVVADEWSVGRVFLAGDAAHMMPPFAGQGLNSGVRDVANLCWKLVAVLRGDLRADCLRSYAQERKPHAKLTIKLSEMLGRVVMTQSHHVAERRDAYIRDMLTTSDGRRYLEEMRYRPQAAIREGLVVNVDRDEMVGSAIVQPRIFDTHLRKARMLDEAMGTGWALIGVHVAATDWDAVAGLLDALKARALHVPDPDHIPRPAHGIRIIVDLDGGLDATFEKADGKFLLIRPDRIVAASWYPKHSDIVHNDIAGNWIPAHRTNAVSEQSFSA